MFSPTPRHRRAAYRTRPRQFDNHKCELEVPTDRRDIREAHLRPKQVACHDCGALWTMASQTEHGSRTVTERKVVPAVHPHPHQHTTFNKTITVKYQVPTTFTTRWWVFEKPQPAPKNAERTPDGKYFWEGRKWVPIANNKGPAPRLQ